MATTGGCSRGNVTWSFEGEHIVICHCNRCKRNNGSLCSVNFIVPAIGFKEMSGKAKTYTSKGPSGNNGSSFFCENCGSPLYIKSDLGAGLVIIKAGSLDDVSLLESRFKPSAETFCETKLNFLPACSRGAEVLPWCDELRDVLNQLKDPRCQFLEIPGGSFSLNKQ